MLTRIPDVLWLVLMLFKAATAILVLAVNFFGETPMPTGAQVWFAMLVAFLASFEVTMRRAFPNVASKVF